MVKFREREIKKKYKHKEYVSKKFLLEFPVKANPKIEPYKNRIFDDLDITFKETLKHEILIIQLIRNKALEENNR